MNIIVLGCGRTGAYLAVKLSAAGHQVTVIDKNSAAFARLGPGFAGPVVIGTGIDEDVLRRAGIQAADALLAVTDADNTNIMAAQVARDIFGVRTVICRIYDPLREAIFRDLGLETICPTLWAAERIQAILEK
jgi:trk system potassium uptake protein TrkA